MLGGCDIESAKTVADGNLKSHISDLKFEISDELSASDGNLKFQI